MMGKRRPGRRPRGRLSLNTARTWRGLGGEGNSQGKAHASISLIDNQVLAAHKFEQVN